MSFRDTTSADVNDSAVSSLTEAALDRLPVSGWTHNFYNYPARFSPRFAAAAIEHFSRPGDLVLDPYMGGGTVVVEGLVAGREVIGNDLNSLATFVTRVKTTELSPADTDELSRWVVEDVQTFGYRMPADQITAFIDLEKTRNMDLVRARFIRKAVGAALASISRLQSRTAQNFARCALLRVGQWALDGRSRHTPLTDFRQKLASTTLEMIAGSQALADRVKEVGGRACLYNDDARALPGAASFLERRVALVVTSPPYPGVHVLYHRWQVDGRRETPAPYWIAGCNDGKGVSYYNFGDRRQASADNYFKNSLDTLQAIRRVMREGAYMIQMIAFNHPVEQLPRYLANMKAAGFEEVSALNGTQRIWRDVPNRKWHARLRGQTHSARELVLVHRAV